nr:hypothetical protein [Raoultella ornithinolytica]
MSATALMKCADANQHAQKVYPDTQWRFRIKRVNLHLN